MAKTAKFPEAQDGRRRGRPRVADDWIQRRKHIRLAYCRLVLKRSTGWCARHFGVSRRTVNYWCKAALGYEDAEALTLQDLVRGPRAPEPEPEPEFELEP